MGSLNKRWEQNKLQAPNIDMVVVKHGKNHRLPNDFGVYLQLEMHKE
jgi:hypothetical protein